MLQTAKKIVRRNPKGRAFKTPKAHADCVKHDRFANRLEAIARKADLVAWALQGVMALEDNDAVWPIQDAAFEIKAALETTLRRYERRGEGKGEMLVRGSKWA
ncbi:MAG: hypothetical protein JJE37_01380 [Methyloceanibacter sp.]|jgi:hypothetical protein|nr:hypothetical protein [Methyloceanibacter sp.]